MSLIFINGYLYSTVRFISQTDFGITIDVDNPHQTEDSKKQSNISSATQFKPYVSICMPQDTIVDYLTNSFSNEENYHKSSKPEKRRILITQTSVK